MITCMKTVLMVYNCFFLALAALVLGFGIFVHAKLHNYMRINPEFAETAPYVLLGTGSIMLFLGVMACCCITKGQPVLLYLYSAFLMTIFVIFGGAGVSGWAYIEPLKNSFEEGLTRAFTLYSRQETIMESVDSLQMSLECCGIHNASDWLMMPYGLDNENDPFPISCCSSHREQGCNAVYSRGCYTTVVNFLTKEAPVFLWIAVALAATQTIGILLSCCLACNVDKARRRKV